MSEHDLTPEEDAEVPRCSPTPATPGPTPPEWPPGWRTSLAGLATDRDSTERLDREPGRRPRLAASPCRRHGPARRGRRLAVRRRRAARSSRRTTAAAGRAAERAAESDEAHGEGRTAPLPDSCTLGNAEVRTSPRDERLDADERARERAPRDEPRTAGARPGPPATSHQVETAAAPDAAKADASASADSRGCEYPSTPRHRLGRRTPRQQARRAGLARR